MSMTGEGVTVVTRLLLISQGLDCNERCYVLLPCKYYNTLQQSQGQQYVSVNTGDPQNEVDL